MRRAHVSTGSWSRGPPSRLHAGRLDCVGAAADGPRFYNRFGGGMAVALRGELQGRHRRAGAAVGSGNKRNNNQKPHVTHSLLALPSRTTMNIIAISDPEPADRRDDAWSKLVAGFAARARVVAEARKSARCCPARRSLRCLQSRRACATARRLRNNPSNPPRSHRHTHDRDRARTFRGWRIAGSGARGVGIIAARCARALGSMRSACIRRGSSATWPRSVVAGSGQQASAIAASEPVRSPPLRLGSNAAQAARLRSRHPARKSART